MIGGRCLMREYLLIAKGDHEVWGAMTEEENERFESRFREWINGMGENWIRGNAVARHWSRISKADNQTEVTRAASGETITGFFLFRAESMDHAVELAKGCPALLYDSLELYELEREG
jgi:hypothetical protein